MSLYLKHEGEIRKDHISERTAVVSRTASIVGLQEIQHLGFEIDIRETLLPLEEGIPVIEGW